jgi:N-acetylneuraminic acid mutarotase
MSYQKLTGIRDSDIFITKPTNLKVISDGQYPTVDKIAEDEMAFGEIDGKPYIFINLDGEITNICLVIKSEQVINGFEDMNVRYYPRNRWINKTPVPQGLYGHTATVVNNKIYVIGGCVTNFDVLDTNYCYDPSNGTGEWVKMANMSSPRRIATASVIGAKIYVIGGADEMPEGSNYCYDTVTNSWTSKASIPSPLYEISGHSAAVVDGKIYIMGGYKSGIKNINYLYDPVTNTWSTRAVMPEALQYHTAETVNGKIYVMGGTNGSEIVNTNYCYDPSTDMWSTKATMLKRLQFHSSAVINGNIYIIGGYTSSGAADNYIYLYSVAGNTYSQLGLLTESLYSSKAVSLNNSIYLIGGRNINGETIDYNFIYNTKDHEVNLTATATSNLPVIYESGNTSIADIEDSTAIFRNTGTVTVTASQIGNGEWKAAKNVSAIMTAKIPQIITGIKDTVIEYDPPSWVQKRNVLSNIAYYGAAFDETNNMVYIIGGSDGGTGKNTNYRYDITNNEWTEMSPIPIGIAQHDAAYKNGYIYVCGGWNYNNNTSNQNTYRYNISNNSWDTVAPLNGSRLGLCMVADNYTSKIYAMCGGTNTNDIYNISSNTWTTGAACPEALEDAALFQHNNKIYIIGGYRSSNYKNTNYCYDTNYNTWETLEPMPEALSQCCAIYGVDSTLSPIWVIGGYNSQGHHDTIYAFNRNTNTWSTSSSFPIKISGIKAAHNYIIGGINSQGYKNTNYIYKSMPLPYIVANKVKATSDLQLTCTSSNEQVATIENLSSYAVIDIVGNGRSLITFSQAGNDTYWPVDLTITLDVNTTQKQDQRITGLLTPSKNYGDPDFNLTAVATSGLPVKYGSSNSAVATISGSTVHIVGGGVSVISAYQDGNANWNAAPAVSNYFYVGKANQTITGLSNITKNSGDADFNLTAVASSGLPVTYSISNTSVAWITNGTVHIAGAGTATITASQEGNESYNYAPDITATLTVNSKNQTISGLYDINKYIDNNDFNLTAKASSGLTVSYTSSNTSVATISGNTVHITGTGTSTITASQAGNSSWNPAPNVTATLNVDKRTQSIINLYDITVTIGMTEFDLSATATSGLEVTYTSSNPSVATISGKTVYINISGTTTITASQAGNQTWYAAQSIQKTMTVNKANQTITGLSNITKTYGDADFNLTATASSGLDVRYFSSNTSVATITPSITGKTVHIVGIGTTTITAYQQGNDYYNAATDITATLTVNSIPKQNQTISGLSNITRTWTPPPLEGHIILSATASSGLTVTYTSSNTSVATISGSTADINGAGTSTITASQGGNDTWNPAPDVTATLTINKANQMILGLSDITKNYGDPDFDLSATASSGGAVRYTSSNTSVATITLQHVHIVAVGTTTITARQDGNTNYNAAPNVTATLTVVDNTHWTVKSDMPQKRVNHAAAAWNGKIYVIGGDDDTKEGNLTATNYCYDIATDTWSTKASIPVAVRFHTATAVSGQIYVICGQTDKSDAMGSNINYCYNIATDTWLGGKAQQPEKNMSHTATAVTGKIYMIGGVNKKTNWCYDTVADTWTQKTAPVYLVNHHSSSHGAGYVFSFGGYGGVSSTSYGLLNVIIGYYINDDNYTITLNTLPMGAVMDHQSVSAEDEINSQIYLLGGKKTSLAGSQEDYNYLYNIITNSWSQKESIPLKISDHTAVQSGGKIYVMGGRDVSDNARKINYCYTP